MNDPIEQFRQAIESAGLSAPDAIDDDGAIHRFSTNGRRGDDSGWYSLHTDGIAAGAFGCWRTGLQSTWCAKSDHAMTQTERDHHRARVVAMQAQREAEQALRHQGAATEAAQRWQTATSCTQPHAYLTTKCVQAHGVRIDTAGALIVPMRDTAGQLHSLQTITPDGDKRFLSGGRVKGCYHSIGRVAGLLIVCEGYATGASLHECTGHAVAVAFNAGNLDAVALALRAKYPHLKIIMAADDDHHTEGNPGTTKARAAAQAVSGFLAVPDFGANRPDKASDFNDLHQLAGVNAVKRCMDVLR